MMFVLYYDCIIINGKVYNPPTLPKIDQLLKILATLIVGENVDNLDYSNIAGRYIKWWTHSGK